MITGYFAAEGLGGELLADLGAIEAQHGRLVLAAGPPLPAPWAQNVWYDPQEFAIASIADGARKLRAIQRNWAVYSHRHHRRAALIQARLPVVRAKPHEFPKPAPAAPLGAWTLLDEGRILAAARCSSPFAHGEVRFVEDKTPPNRAYLKLWELFTVLGRRPARGEVCVELGASPGGWTWVLAKLGCRVTAVDKAPLDRRVAAMPGVTPWRGSAFALDPAQAGPVDWLFADVACYPARLLGLVRAWLAAGAARNVVATIKFQGATDHETTREFAAIPGARLMHLFHNKHELTFVRLETTRRSAESAPGAG